MSSMSSTAVHFSAGYDPELGERELKPLLRQNGGKWEVIESGRGVQRGFRFKSFKKTWVCNSPFLFSFFFFFFRVQRIP